MRNFKKIAAVMLACTSMVAVMGTTYFADTITGDETTTPTGTTYTEGCAIINPRDIKQYMFGNSVYYNSFDVNADGKINSMDVADIKTEILKNHLEIESTTETTLETWPETTMGETTDRYEGIDLNYEKEYFLSRLNEDRNMYSLPDFKFASEADTGLIKGAVDTVNSDCSVCAYSIFKGWHDEDVLNENYKYVTIDISFEYQGGFKWIVFTVTFYSEA